MKITFTCDVTLSYQLLHISDLDISQVTDGFVDDNQEAKLKAAVEEAGTKKNEAKKFLDRIKETQEDTYKKAVEKHLDWWTVGTNGERITYTPKGLAWLDSWGSLRYATTTGYIASIYAEWDGCSAEKKKIYEDFALSQAGYALGDTGRSFEIGFGKDYPKNPHHRTAQGSYCDNMNEPGQARHTLYGALVGGPDASDDYTDTVNDYTTNEVASLIHRISRTRR